MLIFLEPIDNLTRPAHTPQMARGLLSTRRLLAAAIVVVATLVAGPVSATAAGFSPYYPVMNAGPLGTGTDQPAGHIELSDQARYVAFTTRTPLVPSDTDGNLDLYVRDNLTGSYDRISAPTDGSTANDGDISVFSTDSDMDHIVFVGNSTHLNGCVGCLYMHHGATNQTFALTTLPVKAVALNFPQVVYYQPTVTDPNAVFVRDLISGDLTQLTLPAGVPTSNYSLPGQFSITVGGTAVAFAVSVTRNVGATTETNRRVLVYRKRSPADFAFDPIDFGGSIPGAADVTSLSAEPGSLAGGNGSGEPLLSGDGRWLSFFSEFTDLVPGDSNNGGDIFYRDLQTPGFPMARISVANDGSEIPHSFAEKSTMSSDGRFVAFNAYDSSAPAASGWSGSWCNCGYIMLWDRDAAAGSRLSVGAVTWDGAADGTFPDVPALNVDGRFLAYTTSNPLETTTPNSSGNADLVLRDRSATYVHATAADGSMVRSQSALDATNPIGMQVTVPTGGDVLLTKARSRWGLFAGSGNIAGTEDVTFQAFIPTQSPSTPATATFGLDPSIHVPSSEYPRLTVAVNGTELPACTSAGTLPSSVSTCQKPVALDGNGGRRIEVLTTQTLGNRIDLAWAYAGTSLPSPDATPPVITGTPARAPDSSPWYNHDVVIHWAATDPSPSSGVPTQPADTTASAEGLDVVYTSGQSCDPASNCATGAYAISLDKTAPTASISAPANGASYTYGASVTPSSSCSDGLSGLATCSAPLLDLTPGTHTFTVTATDHAGNSAQAQSTYTFVDGSTSQTVASGGTVTTDPSGLGATPTSPVQTAVTSPTSGSVSISTSGTVTQTPPSTYDLVSEQVQIDAPPATTTNPLTLTFTIDASKLGLQPDGSNLDANNLIVMRNGVPITSSCTVAGQAVPDPCVASRSTTASGDAVIVVNSSHASGWNFGYHKPFTPTSPFYAAPISNTARNYAKAGNVVGFKFGLSGYQGLDILAANSPTSVVVASCAAPTGKYTVIPGSNSSAPTLSYDKKTNTYTYNWRTLTAWANTCRTFTLTLADGSRHNAGFYFTN